MARIVARPDEPTEAGDRDLPGLQKHRLRANLSGVWLSVASGDEWAIFRLGDGRASDIDLIDCHFGNGLCR